MVKIVNNYVIGNLNKGIKFINSALSTSINEITPIIWFFGDSVDDVFTQAFWPGSTTEAAFNHLMEVSDRTFQWTYTAMDNVLDGLQQTYADFYWAKLPKITKDGVWWATNSVTEAADKMKEALENAGKWWKWWASETNKELEKQKKLYEEIVKEINKAMDSQLDGTKDVRDWIKDHIEDLTELQDKYDELWKEASEKLKALSDEFDDIGKWYDEKLAERIVEIDARLQEIAEARADWWDMSTREVRELDQEQIKLEQERAEALAATTQEALSFAQARDQMSETQRMLYEEQEKLFDVEQRKRQFMDEYEARKTALDMETEAVTSALAKQVSEYETSIEKIKSMFKSHFSELDASARWQTVTLVSEYQKIIDKLNEVKAQWGVPWIVSWWWNIQGWFVWATSTSLWGININFGQVTITNNKDEEDFVRLVDETIKRSVRDLQLGYK